MTTVEKRRFRIGPSGVREVFTYGRRVLYLPMESTALDDIELPLVRVLTREERIEREGLAAIEAREREEEALKRRRAEDERLRPLFEMGYKARDAGIPPQYAAWCNERIVHLQWTPWCASGMTLCGYRVGERWTTAIGIPDDRRGRVCLRCQAHAAFELSRAAGVPFDERPTQKDFRRDPEADEKLWKDIQ